MALSHASRYTFRLLEASDLALMKDLLRVFGDAFDDVETYQGAVPSDEYLAGLLSGPSFIAIVALDGTEVVGGLAAYELQKFERQRREIYIYDLAVAEAHRRRGIARTLIATLQRVAVERDAYVIYVQADLADAPAIALYESVGRREDVIHFDITVRR
jgi:aminoglycoside 3-N-acetyltransferase I